MLVQSLSRLQIPRPTQHRAATSASERKEAADEFLGSLVRGDFQELMTVWKTNVGGRILEPPGVAPDGSLAFLNDEGLVVLDPNGEEKSRINTRADLFTTPKFLKDGRVAVVSQTGLKVFKGAQLDWEQPVGNIHTSPEIDDNGNIYVATRDRRVFCFEPDGKKVWERDLSPELLARIRHDRESDLRHDRYRLERGEVTESFRPQLEKMAQRREHDLKDPEYGSESLTEIQGGPSLGPDGRTYVFTQSGPIFALDEQGTLAWQGHNQMSGREVNFTPEGELLTLTSFSHIKLLDEDGRTEWLYGGFTEERLDKLSPEASQKARRAGNVGAATVPEASPDGRQFYFSGLDGKLRAVSNKGEKLWSLELQREGSHSSPDVEVGDDGTVYAVGPRGVDAVSPEGKKLWQFRVKDKYVHLALVGEKVCLATYGGNVYLLDNEELARKQKLYESGAGEAETGATIEFDDGYLTVGDFGLEIN